MKDKDIRNVLSEYAGSPDYLKKDAFIRKMQKESRNAGVSVFRMIAVQAGHIRAYIWFVFAFVLIGPMFNSVSALPTTLEVFTLIMPFFSSIGIFEAMRSRMHNMSELEMATLLSKQGTFFARMIIIGSVQFAVIAVLSVVFSMGIGIDAISVGTGLLLPFTLTNILCFMIARTQFGRENAWFCLPVSVLVAAIGRYAVVNMSFATRIDKRVWTLLALALIVLQISEFYKTVKTERFSWN